jgi:hypothetical protein
MTSSTSSIMKSLLVNNPSWTFEGKGGEGALFMKCENRIWGMTNGVCETLELDTSWANEQGGSTHSWGGKLMRKEIWNGGGKIMEGGRDVARWGVWCDGSILANAKFTNEHTNFVIPLSTLSQFQMFILHSSLKIYNFLNDLITLTYNLFFLYKPTIMVNINVNFFFHFIFFFNCNYVWTKKLFNVHHALNLIEWNHWIHIILHINNNFFLIFMFITCTF